jgi:hypothetical protein
MSIGEEVLWKGDNPVNLGNVASFPENTGKFPLHSTSAPIIFKDLP